MIGNPFRRHPRPRVDDMWRVPVQLMFSAYYDPALDCIVVGVKAAGESAGPAVELSLWDAVSVQDMIGAAIGDALAASDGTV